MGEPAKNAEVIADNEGSRLYIRAKSSDLGALINRILAHVNPYGEMRVIPHEDGTGYSICFYKMEDPASAAKRLAPGIAVEVDGLAEQEDQVIDDSDPEEATVQRDGLKGLFRLIHDYSGKGTDRDEKIRKVVYKHRGLFPLCDEATRKCDDIISVMASAGIKSADNMAGRPEEERESYLIGFLSKIRNVFSLD